jgi:hypothetical protein
MEVEEATTSKILATQQLNESILETMPIIAQEERSYISK